MATLAQTLKDYSQSVSLARNFNPADGTGHVAPSTGDYDFAIAKGHDVRLLLIETYGGFGVDLNRLFRAAAHSLTGQRAE